ncbi:MAG: ribose 5-phosphate isomerase B [Rubricoccaceae bacterium]|nr:ribose 5-phosphate isomerase B [Rubricoccaceae bacterium]
MPKRLLTEQDVLDALRAGKSEIEVVPGTLVTALAKDVAKDKGISIVERVETDAYASVKTGSEDNRVLAVGCDHAGFTYKGALITHADSLGWTVIDVGTTSEASVDYPDFAFAVAELVRKREARFGLIFDGVGVGSAMVANKVTGIRAALCPDVFSAFNARAHNDANVITMGSRTMGIESCKRVLAEFLSTDFEGGRHAKRVNKIRDVESRFLPGIK